MAEFGARSKADASERRAAGGRSQAEPTIRLRVSRPYRPDLIPRIPLVHRAEDFESAFVALSF
jgi:hypothetical protein